MSLTLRSRHAEVRDGFSRGSRRFRPDPSSAQLNDLANAVGISNIFVELKDGYVVFSIELVP